MWRDRGLQIGYDGRGDVEREVLRPVVLLGRRDHPVLAGEGLVAVHGHAGVLQGGDHPRHERLGDVGVHEQRLGGVAHRRPVGLGVEHDGQRQVEVGVPVDVHVAVADPGLDHRHRRLLDDGADQAGAAARDQHVDQAAGPHQRLRRLVPLPRDQLHRVGRQAGSLRGLAEHGHDRGVGAAGARGAPQQHGVAALEADAGRVGGHVGTGLVDDPDDAERHAHLAQLEAVGEGRAADHLADGVGQRRDVAQPVGHPGHPAGVQAAAGRRARRGCRPRGPPTTSSALAASTSSVSATRASAIACSAASLVARVASASSCAASRARSATASKVMGPG